MGRTCPVSTISRQYLFPRGDCTGRRRTVMMEDGKNTVLTVTGQNVFTAIDPEPDPGRKCAVTADSELGRAGIRINNLKSRGIIIFHYFI
jgi:hypothetical protein